MRHYEKTFENVLPVPSDKNLGVRVEKLGSTLGGYEILADKFRELHHKAHRDFFDTMVKQVWLERQFTYGGKMRSKRNRNGNADDWAYGYFMKAVMGINQKPVTCGFLFQSMVTYLPELFPDFFSKDPYVDTEYYLFPFKNIGIDQMVFVYRMKERMELLRYSEEHKMTFSEFVNWVVNYAFSLNQEAGRDIYALKPDGRYFMHIFPIETDEEKAEKKRVVVTARKDALAARRKALVEARKAIKKKRLKEKARLRKNLLNRKWARSNYKKQKNGKRK